MLSHLHTSENVNKRGGTQVATVWQTTPLWLETASGVLYLICCAVPVYRAKENHKSKTEDTYFLLFQNVSLSNTVIAIKLYLRT
jgi:hypothetical protein